ncbi:hypothetical protein R3P38DRAFT_3225397 [Favolaschia claudopus]|uniref:Uncharacterized protein n=1 Tax=Favolaschia claudopus TaxID=2862362 RepID=A0AAV9ZW27_9AGAR
MGFWTRGLGSEQPAAQTLSLDSGIAGRGDVSHAVFVSPAALWIVVILFGIVASRKIQVAQRVDEDLTLTGWVAQQHSAGPNDAASILDMTRCLRIRVSQWVFQLVSAPHYVSHAIFSNPSVLIRRVVSLSHVYGFQHPLFDSFLLPTTIRSQQRRNTLEWGFGGDTFVAPSKIRCHIPQESR